MSYKNKVFQKLFETKEVELSSDLIELGIVDSFKKAIKELKNYTKNYGELYNKARLGHEKLDDILKKKNELEAQEKTTAKETSDFSDSLVFKSKEASSWLDVAEKNEKIIIEKYKELGLKPPKELSSEINEQKNKVKDLRKKATEISKLPLKKK